MSGSGKIHIIPDWQKGQIVMVLSVAMPARVLGPMFGDPYHYVVEFASGVYKRVHGRDLTLINPETTFSPEIEAVKALPCLKE